MDPDAPAVHEVVLGERGLEPAGHAFAPAGRPQHRGHGDADPDDQHEQRDQARRHEQEAHRPDETHEPEQSDQRADVQHQRGHQLSRSHTRFAHSRARATTSRSSTETSTPLSMITSPATMTPDTGARSSPPHRCSNSVREENSVAGR